MWRRRLPPLVSDGRSVAAPALLLRRLARRITGIARGLLLGEQRSLFLFFLSLQRRHNGGFLGGELGCLLGGLLRSLCVGLRLQSRGFGARGLFLGLLARARFLALTARFGYRPQLRLALFVFLVA